MTEVGGDSTYGETPDAIGWHSRCSVVVECKISRNDFLADKKKPFRVEPKKGMGTFRFYLVPKGLLKVADVSGTEWGILEYDCTKKRRVGVLVPGKKFEAKSIKAESQLLYLALQRVQYRIAKPLCEVISWSNYGVTEPILNVDEMPTKFEAL